MGNTHNAQKPEHNAPQVVIAGAGMVGMAAALALAQGGVHVTLADPVTADTRTDPAFDGRVSAIAYGSRLFLERIGMWQYALPVACPILDIRVVDRQAERHVHYHYRDAWQADAAADAPPMGHIVENRHLRLAFLRAAGALGPRIRHHAAAIAALDSSGVRTRVTLSDGTELAADLVVAADGKRSPVRAMAGIGVDQAAYGQTALVSTIAHALPHGNLALERFLPGGPFAVLPMPDDDAGLHRSSLVWVEPERWAPRYLDLPDATLNAEIQRRVGEHLGAIQAVGPRFSYPLAVSQARRYTADKLVLIGDAAHGIHPIAGQGVNLGFRDAQILAERVLETARLGLPPGHPEVLNQYVRARRVDTVSMIAVTDGLTRLFGSASPLVAFARQTGLGAVNHLPALKRRFMRHAMGLH